MDRDLNVINIFASATEAFKVTGIPRRMISGCCNGTKKSAHGYLWKFLDEEKHRQTSTVSIKIKKYDINHNFICEYESISQVKRIEHIAPQTLKKHIKSKTLYNGFYWEYA